MKKIRQDIKDLYDINGLPITPIRAEGDAGKNHATFSAIEKTAFQAVTQVTYTLIKIVTKKNVVAVLYGNKLQERRPS